jgi:hypothetical protein
VDNMVQKVCALACTNTFQCQSGACCTLLSNGTGACIQGGGHGQWPGQLCLCGGPGGATCNAPQVCSPAKDNAGNPTGPNVCQ